MVCKDELSFRYTGELGDLPFLPEMPVDPVLFDWHMEHGRSGHAVDVPAFCEDPLPPALASEPCYDAGLDSAEV